LSTATAYSFDWSNLETTEDLTGLNPGTYTVVVTSAEGCDTTMVFDVMNTASIEENDLLNMSLSIQPNPASTYFTVKINLPQGKEAEVRITDALGKVIQKTEVNGLDELIINSTNFAPGTYFVSLSSERVTKMERLIIYNN